jgi:coenzyme F420-dependent glucose-6-phosphate dehydrogenase
MLSIYTLPDDLPSIMVAAGGKLSGDVAGRIGDGLIATSPDTNLWRASRRQVEGENRCMGSLTVCWGESEAEARQTAYKWWPNTVLPGYLSADLIGSISFRVGSKTGKRG